MLPASFMLWITLSVSVGLLELHSPHMVFLNTNLPPLVNAALKQHNRVVYSSQAIQHVSQQIASLYWSTVSQATREVTSLEKGVDRTVDLSSHP